MAIANFGSVTPGLFHVRPPLLSNVSKFYIDRCCSHQMIEYIVNNVYDCMNHNINHIVNIIVGPTHIKI